MYKDNHMKEVSWKTIAARLDCPDNVDQVKKKWKNLRDTFAKAHTKHVQSGGNQPCRWHYYNSMLFIESTLQTRQPGNLQQPGSDDDAGVDESDFVMVGDDEHEEEAHASAPNLPPTPGPSNSKTTSAKKRSYDSQVDEELLATLRTLKHKNPVRIPPVAPTSAVQRQVAKTTAAPAPAASIVTAVDYEHSKEDMHDVFGRSVAAQLRVLPETSQAWARFKISEVLFTAATQHDLPLQLQNLGTVIYTADAPLSTSSLVPTDIVTVKEESN